MLEIAPCALHWERLSRRRGLRLNCRRRRVLRRWRFSSLRRDWTKPPARAWFTRTKRRAARAAWCTSSISCSTSRSGLRQLRQLLWRVPDEPRGLRPRVRPHGRQQGARL